MTQNSKLSRMISFEGIEGSGKTTQIQKLKSYLEEKGYDVLCIREPGGTSFGEALRNAMLNAGEPITVLAQAHLFASSRAQLLSDKILPFLKKPNSIVIIDRYIDSSLVYQGIAGSLGIETIEKIHSTYPLTLRPELTLLLDIELSTSMARQNLRRNEKDFFESKSESFYRELHKGYRSLVSLYPDRVKPIAGEAEIETVFSDILKQIREKLEI